MSTDQTKETPRSPLLTLEDISVSYGQSYGLRDVSLSLESGEILALVGPSGSGKTTLLHSVAGLIPPNVGTVTGRVIFDGLDISTIPPERRGIPLLFQSVSLFPHLSVRDNIAFPLHVRRSINGSRLDSRVRDLARLVHLDLNLLDRHSTSLSGGQQQRVGLARSLAALDEERKSHLLLLDEPLSSLDPHVRDAIQDEIQELQKRLNLGILYVTHSREEAMRVGDRIAVIAGGRLHQIAPPQEVYSRPSSAFVAYFFGLKNILPCRVVALADDSIVVATQGLDTPFSVKRDRNLKVSLDELISVLINPAGITIHDTEGSGDTSNVIPARFIAQKFLGEYWEIDIRIGAVALSARRLTGIESLGPGDEILACWDVDATTILPDVETN